MASTAAPASQNAEILQQVADEYVDEHRPGHASSGQDDLSAAAFLARIGKDQERLERLLSIDPEGLSQEQDIDRRLLIGITRSRGICP